MATVVTLPAESAPAEPQPNFEPSTWTHNQREAWINTGSVPESNIAESTPAPTSAEPEKAEPSPESAPVSTQEKTRPNADTRKAELNAEIQELLRKRNELRKDVEGGKDVTAASSTAEPAKETKLAAPAKPTFGESGHDNETWEQFEGRTSDYQKSFVAYEVKETLRAEREENEKQRKEAETAKANRQIEESWNERVEKAASLKADFAEVAFSKDVPISPVMDGFILDSQVGPAILYYFGSHKEEAKAIAGMSPYAAARALVKIESSVSESSVSEPQGTDTPPAVPVTKAAKPSTELNARNGATPDPVRDAVERQDVTAYMEAANAADIARHRSGSRR